MFHAFRSRRFFNSQLKKYPLELQQFNYNKANNLYLNNVDDAFLNGKRCAVIGNSGHLLDQNLADEIDQHDVVFRFSLAPVKGFENKVGQKTTLRIINNKVFSGIKDPMAPEERDDQLLDFINDRILVVSWDNHLFQQSIFKFMHAKQLLFLNPSFKNEICNRYFYRSATTGFIGIILALHYFEKVSLFGFNFYEGDWKKRHYFESCKKYVSEHSHNEEKYIVHTLADQGHITIH